MTGRLLRALASVVALPVPVALVVPGALLWLERDLGFRPVPPAGLRVALLALGCGFVLSGLVLVVQTVRLFFRVGEGTLAPWDPPERFVVRGVYRYVRNPMITGVALVLAGEALMLVSAWVLAWALVFVIANGVYIPRFEEPGLDRRFGEAYRAYCRAVPRWIPRRKPWDAPRTSGDGR